MPKLLTLDDVDPQGKTVIVRVDFNSPIDPKTKNVLDDTRIKRHAETTIKELIQKGAKVGILAHQGRRGEPDFTTLKQHAEILSKILEIPVKYVNDVFGPKAQEALKGLKSGEVLVLENVRTYAYERTKGTPEKHAKSEMVEKLAPLADLFVNDAFAAAHRAHVSIVGFTSVLPSFAGRIMEKELKSLSLVLENPKKPCIFILGGAKADDALEISRYVLENKIADYVLTGGVAGHVFLTAKDIDLGEANMSFLKRKDLIRFIPGIKNLLKSYPDQILVPFDLALEIDGKRKEIPIQKLPTNYPIFDVGSETVKIYSEIIRKANSIVLSGPLGVYEKEEFIFGTKSIFQEVANSPRFSLAGGGHTVAALQELGISSKISYISTAGGALIDFLMGKELPGIVSLEKAVTKKL
ncbi:MAG: phosphoglycerate kinase [Candidatus Bathyarchaeota archaeon]|jgi:phosphoglycerate kinase